MSEISLYSGLYEQMREYAEHVDSVLIALKAGTSKPTDASRQKLAELLICLSADRCDDFSVQRLVVILRHKTGFDSKWPWVGHALLSITKGTSIPLIESLENLARSLEDEQVRVVARMRGGMR